MKKAYGYKLFRQTKDGKLHPLYVNSSQVLPVGEWLPAESGERTANGKVKSSLGELAYRGGWHLNDKCPYVEHIYTKKFCEDGQEIDGKGRKFRKIQKKTPYGVW